MVLPIKLLTPSQIRRIVKMFIAITMAMHNIQPMIFCTSCDITKDHRFTIAIKGEYLYPP